MPHLNMRPLADLLINTVNRLRAERVSPNKARVEIARLFPRETKTHQSRRSDFFRVFSCSERDYQNVLAAYDGGKNYQVLKDASATRSIAGAPIGNLNAIGKRKGSPVPRICKLWDAMSLDEREKFLDLRGLKRNKRTAPLRRE